MNELYFSIRLKLFGFEFRNNYMTFTVLIEIRNIRMCVIKVKFIFVCLTLVWRLILQRKKEKNEIERNIEVC